MNEHTINDLELLARAAYYGEVDQPAFVASGQREAADRLISRGFWSSMRTRVT